MLLFSVLLGRLEEEEEEEQEKEKEEEKGEKEREYLQTWRSGKAAISLDGRVLDASGSESSRRSLDDYCQVEAFSRPIL